MTGLTVTSLDTLPDLSRFASTSSKWHRGDNELVYARNLKSGKTPPYGPDDIDYDFNHLGFRNSWYRSPELLEIGLTRMAVYGCSNVFGYGLPEEDSVSNQISLNTGCEVYNMAIAGSSNDLIARTITSTVPLMLPSRVFVYWTYFSRREIYAEDGYAIPWLKNWRKQTVQPADEHIPLMQAQEQLHNEASNINNFIRNLSLVDLFLRSLDVDFSWAVTNDYLLMRKEVMDAVSPYMNRYVDMPLPRIQEDVSRDMTHPGKKTSQKIARGFLSSM